MPMRNVRTLEGRARWTVTQLREAAKADEPGTDAFWRAALSIISNELRRQRDAEYHRLPRRRVD